jgi:hypothetical protein
VCVCMNACVYVCKCANGNYFNGQWLITIICMANDAKLFFFSPYNPGLIPILNIGLEKLNN